MLNRFKCISKQLSPKLSMHSHQNLRYGDCPTLPYRALRHWVEERLNSSVATLCAPNVLLCYMCQLRKGSCQSKPWRAYGARICMQCETLCLCIIIHLKEYPLCKLVLCASGFCLVSMPCKRWWCVASVVHRMSGGGVRVLPRLVLVSSMLTCLVRLRLCLFPIIIGLLVEISDNFTKHLAYLC